MMLPSSSSFSSTSSKQMQQQLGNRTEQKVADSKDKVNELRIQVDQVVDVMQANLQKVAERGETLGSLQTKSEELSNASLQFNRASKDVNRSIWWKNMKWNIILGTAGLVITGGIIASIVTSINGGNGGAAAAQQGNQPS